MRVSTKGRYALRLMLDLAGAGSGEYVALKDISARQGVSMKYLEQIASQLCKAGFLKSVRGPQGGYMLSKEPAQYTVGSILRITEGSLSPVACIEDEPNQCPRRSICPTLGFWQGLHDAVNQYVDGCTLQNLMDNG